jgi:rod shape-determining protein MreD
VNVSLLLPILVGYVALALQATLVPHVGIADIRPDLPIVATVMIALGRGAGAGTTAGFLIGLGQDLTNPAFLGLNALSKSLLGYGLGTLRERFDAGTMVTHVAVLFVATIAHDLLYLTIYMRLVLSEMMLALVTRTLPTALYTAFVGVWAFALMSAMTGRRSSRFGRSRIASH